MAVPAAALRLGKVFDPKDVKPFRISYAPMLAALGPGAKILTFVITILDEGIAGGLNIMTGDGRDPAISADGLYIDGWHTIDEDMQEDAMFEAVVDCPFTCFVRTTTSPYSEDEQTFILSYQQQ